MNSDSSTQPKPQEIININSIFFEDSFIDLLNNLSQSIVDLYRNIGPLIKSSQSMEINFELNITILSSMLSTSKSELSQVVGELKKIKDNYQIITKGINDNMKIFKERARKIFREMKNEKSNKVEDIYNDYARKHSLKNEQQKIKIDPLRKTNQSNNSNKNIKKERNKILNKNIIMENEKKNNNEFDINVVLNLIKKLGEYNTIIKKHSVEDSEAFNNIQKQIILEINKSFNMAKVKSIEGKNLLQSGAKKEKEEKNPFIMVNNNSNNVTMTTTNNNSYYNIIDKDNLKELKTASFHNNYDNNVDLNNEASILKNKNNILEQKLKEYEEEMVKMKEEYELKYKSLNDKNTSLSKDLVNKNHEIQLLQNSNKLKLSEITKMKLIVKTNEKQLKVQKKKVEELKEKSPGNIRIKDLLGNKKGIIDIKNMEEKIEKLQEEIKLLKDTIDKKNENIIELENEANEIKGKNKLIIEELNYKNNKIINDEKDINNLISEKDKLISKIKENKNMENSLKLQINTLKIQIKEMIRVQKEDSEPYNNKTYDVKKELKKQNNDLICENLNLKYQLEYELNFNKELKSEVKEKDVKIDKLNLTINKLMSEKEHLSLNKEINNDILKQMNSSKRINTDSGHKLEKEEVTIKKNNTIGKNQNRSDKKNNKFEFDIKEKE